MAKRKSFDEKAKGMHKSRKLIIDTVFGREDNTQRVHGYEGETEVKHEVGEIWTDSDGKKWQQHKGFKSAVTDLDSVRNFLSKLSNCSKDECKTIKYTHIDKKLIRKTGMCLDCLQKEETLLRLDGTWPYYEDYKITRNSLAFVIDDKMKMEDAFRGLAKTYDMITETGQTEQWTWDIDIEQVKEDLQKDITGAAEAIETLKERKAVLEEKLIEFGHPELIKK
jgi:hypothetical protein